MKLKTFIMLISLGISMAAIAQVPDTIQVKPDTTRTFSIANTTNAVAFNWTIAGNAHTGTPVLGTNSTTGNITFVGTSGNLSTLTVIPESENNCQGNAKQIILKVSSTMNYTAAFSNVDAFVCPVSTNNPTGGKLNATISITGAAGVNAGNPVNVSYTINGTPAATSLVLTSASEAVQFDLTSMAAGAVEIQITGIKFGKIISASSASANSTLDALPVVNDIF